METTINERFSSLIDALKTNPNAFAKSINKSYTAVENTLKGRTKPGFDMLEAIFAVYPQVNTDWLIGGQGEMFRLTSKPADGGAFGEAILNEIRALRDQLTVKDTQIAGLQESQRNLQDMLKLVLGKSKGAAFTQLSEEEVFELTMDLYKQVGTGKAPVSPVNQPRRFDMPTPARPAALR